MGIQIGNAFFGEEIIKQIRKNTLNNQVNYTWQNAFISLGNSILFKWRATNDIYDSTQKPVKIVC